MRFYNSKHNCHCGVDLHSKAMYICIVNSAGEIVFHRNIPAEPQGFLRAIAPFRDNLVVGCECIYSWNWLADLCEREGIEFVLGHALYTDPALSNPKRHPISNSATLLLIL